jgi:FkbM family methyltransferase
VNGTSKLIFDVGACNGDDSAYYLHKGFDVVAVEANPLQVEQLQKRFRSEIETGRYVLIPMGIADTEGEAEFWVCDDWAEWSSFDRKVASYAGARHHSINVKTVRFRSLVERFGSPHYCKVDIEGNDYLCLQDLDRSTAPQLISVEASDGEREIRQLRELGYTKFKVISQLSLRQIPLPIAHLKARLPLRPRNWFERVQAKVWRHRFDGTWRFPSGCSGPFDEPAQGPWLSADEASERNRLFERGTGMIDWQDIHATV